MAKKVIHGHVQRLKQGLPAVIHPREGYPGERGPFVSRDHVCRRPRQGDQPCTASYLVMMTSSTATNAMTATRAMSIPRALRRLTSAPTRSSSSKIHPTGGKANEPES